MNCLDKLKYTFNNPKFMYLLTRLYRESQINYSNLVKDKIVLSQDIGTSRERDLISSLQWIHGSDNIKYTENFHKADMLFFDEFISIKHITDNRLNWRSIKYDWNSNPNCTHKSINKFIDGEKVHHMLIIVHDFRKHSNIDVFFINKSSFLDNLKRNSTDIFKVHTNSNSRGYSFSNSFISNLHIERIISYKFPEEYVISTDNIKQLQEIQYLNKIKSILPSC